MKPMNKKRLFIVAAGVLALAAVATPQLKQILKVGGVVAIVNNYGGKINDQFNRLWKRDEGPRLKTKVVTILSVGNNGNAVGIAQVMGPPSAVDKVVAVAQPEFKFPIPIIGSLRLKALIPVSSKNVIENIKAVDEVGVSGIIDIKL